MPFRVTSLDTMYDEIADELQKLVDAIRARSVDDLQLTVDRSFGSDFALHRVKYDVHIRYYTDDSTTNTPDTTIHRIGSPALDKTPHTT